MKGDTIRIALLLAILVFMIAQFKQNFLLVVTVVFVFGGFYYWLLGKILKHYKIE